MARRILTNPTAAGPIVAGGLVIVGILWAANQKPRRKTSTAPTNGETKPTNGDKPEDVPKKDDPSKKDDPAKNKDRELVIAGDCASWRIGPKWQSEVAVPAILALYDPQTGTLKREDLVGTQFPTYLYAQKIGDYTVRQVLRPYLSAECDASFPWMDRRVEGLTFSQSPLGYYEGPAVDAYETVLAEQQRHPMFPLVDWMARMITSSLGVSGEPLPTPPASKLVS